MKAMYHITIADRNSNTRSIVLTWISITVFSQLQTHKHVSEAVKFNIMKTSRFITNA